MQDIWETAFGKEVGNIAQGDSRTKTKDTNYVFVISYDEIKIIPKIAQ